MAYLLGLDGGGTKTHCILYNSDNDSYDLVEYGSTSHEQLRDGLEGVRNQLVKILDDLLYSKGLSPEDLSFATFGMAGVDTSYQHDMLHALLRELGLKNFQLCNDAFLGIKAGTPRGCGLCLINGTGFNVVGINEKDRMFQSGSQFELTGDYGGGLILGKEVVKTVYLNLYRERKDTILNRMVMKDLEIDRKEDFIETISLGVAEGRIRIPALAKYIFDAAGFGDEQCCDILRRVGREYALSVKTVLEELPFEGRQIDLVLAGSLFTKRWNDLSVHTLEGCLQEFFPDHSFNLRYLKVPPVLGALAWSWQNCFQDADLEKFLLDCSNRGADL